MLSAILLIACSDQTGETVISNVSAAPHLKLLDTTPANKANPYDYIGLRYSDLLIAYRSGNHKPSNFTEAYTIVRSLENNTLLPVNSTSIQNLLSECLNSPDITLAELLSSSGLSDEAKVTLAGFIDNFETLSAQPFSQAYNDITAIENNVQNSVGLPGNDQRVILAVTSISRYLLYNSCCGDTDWRKSVGNIVAATAGALENDNFAIGYCMIINITQLENIQI